jgi:enoyl-[acyl-carrier protein] reductase III
MTGPELDLAGRAVVVTGGTRGIGGAVSRELAARGARVTAWYRADRDAAARTESYVRDAGGAIVTDAGNLGDPSELRRLAAALLGREPRIDGLVHCAALGSFKSPLALKPAQFDLSLGVGARSFLLLAQELAPAMPAGARLIAISSLGATRVVPSYGALGFAKATLEAIVRELAVELAPRGLKVNAISAGPVEGSSIRAHPDYEEVLERLRARAPGGHLATAGEIARLAAWLFSPLADGLCGQILVVDGGLSLLL